METFFIYPDNELYPLPANKASVPLVVIDGDPDEIVAYAGTTWKICDLSDRDYCIAWGVRDSDEFDEWLEEQGYMRFVDS